MLFMSEDCLYNSGGHFSWLEKFLSKAFTRTQAWIELQQRKIIDNDVKNKNKQSQ